ncbi:HAD family hydrolase, partial [Streptomyces sp. SID5785]|nr:HAD family hydrolase [Streptomyces sp. SID5785]
YRPTYVDLDLRGLLTGQPEVVEDGGAFRCGGWSAAAGDGSLELTGDGPAIDGLRTLCGAAWSAAGDGVCDLSAEKALARLEL